MDVINDLSLGSGERLRFLVGAARYAAGGGVFLLVAQFSLVREVWFLGLVPNLHFSHRYTVFSHVAGVDEHAHLPPQVIAFGEVVVE